jgi:hypothetical protein
VPPGSIKTEQDGDDVFLLLHGKPSPLAARAWERNPKAAPTSDRIPGTAAAHDFMHAHKWKRYAGETEATVKEIRRKASKIAPAHNKGALQYLPDD